MDLDELDPRRIPRHVAIVMDGNGRWAQKRGLPRTEGHAAGEDALYDTVQGALELGLGWLTVYAFSTENWRRPADEVRFLMHVNESVLTRRRDEFHAQGVRIRVVGRRDWRVPRRLLRRMAETEELTARNRGMTLTVAFNYGGRAEIVDAVRALVEAGTPASKIDEKAIRRNLYDPEMPDPDLVLRTSGEFRISNFLLWELAYSELVFSDVLWPDFRRGHLVEAIAEYQRRDRRFGAEMPGVYRDVGIALRTVKLGEADRIVTFVTEGHGKVRAVAKGVRKTKSRLGARVEPPTHVSLQLWEGRELDVVTGAEALDHFKPVRTDLDRLTRANALLEAVDAVVQEREEDPRIYVMLLGALRVLSAQEAPLVVPAFYWKLLAQQGVGPVVDVCAHCGEVGDLVAFDVVEGGTLCRSCRSGTRISPDAVRLLQRILGGELVAVLAEPASAAGFEVEALATTALEAHLERRLRSVRLIDRH